MPTNTGKITLPSTPDHVFAGLIAGANFGPRNNFPKIMPPISVNQTNKKIVTIYWIPFELISLIKIRETIAGIK